MRKKVIAANWKMNKSLLESKEYLDSFSKLNLPQDRDIILFVPYTSLHLQKESSVYLGAQNMYFEDSGAFTGEISADMIKSAGCSHVLIGHSDRRHIFHETDEEINKKIRKAINHNFEIVFCVGETAEEKKEGKTKKVIEEQLISGLKDISSLNKIIIAYEPVWAISRGDPNVKSATIDDAENAHKLIRSLIEANFDKDNSEKVRIIYGGSMKPDNAKELLKMPDIDGGLVGNASLDPESFAKICNS